MLFFISTESKDLFFCFFLTFPDNKGKNKLTHSHIQVSLMRQFSCFPLQYCGLLHPRCGSDPCQPSAQQSPRRRPSLMTSSLSVGSWWIPRHFGARGFWWSGEQVAGGGGGGGGGRGRWGGGRLPKNTHSALSTSGRCTQGPRAAQTEIKSRENSGSGARVFYVCVCVCVFALAPSSDISGYLTTPPSIT